MSDDPRCAWNGDARPGSPGSAWAALLRPADEPGGRIFRPEMLMIGATGRNTGKTELACRVIRRHAADAPIAALKVTTVERADGSCPHGGEACGACSSLAESWCVTREIDADSDKDTSKLLASGAREAYWLRVKDGALDAGAAGMIGHVPRGWVSVCESNSLSRVVEPGLFLQVRAEGDRSIKASARAVARLVDHVVVSDGSGFDLSLDRISLLDREWALQRDACAVMFADTPAGAPTVASLKAQFTHVEFATVPDTDVNRRLLSALAVASPRSACDWCLVAWACAGPIPAGIVNAMFRRRERVDAVVARDTSVPSSPPLVLVHRGFLQRIAEAVGGAAPRAAELSELGRVKELRLARGQPTAEGEGS